MSRPLLLPLPLFLLACSTPQTDATAVAPPANEQDVKPGINDGFLAEDLDVDKMVQRFETESREIFAERTGIARAVGLRADMTIADVGAGTGLFTFLFAQDVGADGKVFAVDISDKMLEHIEARTTQRKLSQVATVLCTEKDVSLPPGSVDVVFACDTYHHFRYPLTTMATIHRALKPGGTFVLVDFERIPGVSREFVLGHVRAGKEVFRDEVERSGFELVEELDLPGLEENYFLRFRRI